jgi:DNA-binding response OmpR family regulator
VPGQSILPLIDNEKRPVLPKVMLVDDDRTMVKLLKTLLELDGFEVFIVRQGDTLIETALETSPDIFLMDYHLPDSTGAELVRLIRANSALADIPVIIASGMDVEEEVIAAGADAFLVKPFDLDDLPNLFMKLIN